MTERILNERYALESKVGEGGMAVTYRARDLLLNRTVAVKLMREQFTTDPQFVERFRREAQAAARLSHENIAGVYDTGRADGAYYIVMEFVEGTDLKQRLRHEGPLPILTALEIGRQIAAALEVAHGKGLVHRDIKPHNILLDKDGKVKVADFGIAKIASETEDTGVIIGSVHYLSPEQARGEGTTPASDLYALGAVLFEMLTGHTVFEGENAMAVAHKQIYDAPTRPRNLRADIPAPLEALVLRCLEKTPDARFTSASEVKAALGLLLNQLAQDETMVIAHPAPAADATVIIRKPAPAAPPSPKTPPAMPAEPPPPSRGGAGGWVIAILFLLMAGVVTYGVLNLSNPTNNQLPPKGQTVPDLTGLTKENVEQVLSRRTLVGQANHELSSTIEEGKVCRQDPVPETVITDPNMPIRYWISDGPQNFTMPDVAGMSLDVAKKEIRIAGYKGKGFDTAKKENSEAVPLGQLIRTEPPAGANVDRNVPKIVLVLSLGPKKEVVIVQPKIERFTYEPGSAPDLGSETVFVHIEYERPAGSPPTTVREGTFKTGEKIPNEHLERNPSEKVIVRMLAAKDENSPLELQGEETFGPSKSADTPTPTTGPATPPGD